MIELIAKDRFEVSGRGTIFLVDLEQRDPKIEINIGDEVLINEEEWIVTGVEMSSGLFGPSAVVGLVVKLK